MTDSNQPPGDQLHCMHAKFTVLVIGQGIVSLINQMWRLWLGYPSAVFDKQAYDVCCVAISSLHKGGDEGEVSIM